MVGLCPVLTKQGGVICNLVERESQNSMQSRVSQSFSGFEVMICMNDIFQGIDAQDVYALP